MVCLPNVSTRPITIHADMFAVYWNDALRTTRKLLLLLLLPDLVASAAAAAAVNTHSMALGWFEPTLLMAFSQYLLFHVSINGCTFLVASILVQYGA